MRAAEIALQPGEEWDPELHLSRADVTFHRMADGTLYAIVMMRPVKNGRPLREMHAGLQQSACRP